MSSVFSRSQSSKISTGAWPPSSSVIRVMLSAAWCINCLPTGTEPVKLTLRMTGDSSSIVLTSDALPWTSCATPAGMPASAKRAEQFAGAAGRFLRRARDHRAAGGERGGDLLGEQIDREIPRGEGRGRADRLADHPRQLAGRADQSAAVVALDLLGIPGEQRRRADALRRGPRRAACPAPGS